MAWDLRRLAQPAVRDLAWVLSAPQVLRAAAAPHAPFPLWHGLAPDALARNQPLLLALDADPALLHDFLRARNRTRLGDRFEALVLFALAHATLAGGQRVLGLRASVALHDRRAEGGAYLRQLRDGDAVSLPTSEPSAPAQQAPQQQHHHQQQRQQQHAPPRIAPAQPSPPPALPPAAAAAAAAAAAWRAPLGGDAHPPSPEPDADTGLVGGGGDGGRERGGFEWWHARRAAGEARRVAKRQAFVARRKAAPAVTVGECDFLFGEAPADGSAPPIVRHLEVSIKFLLLSDTLTAAKRAGTIAAHIPAGTGLRCVHAGCAIASAAGRSPSPEVNQYALEVAQPVCARHHQPRPPPGGGAPAGREATVVVPPPPEGCLGRRLGAANPPPEGCLAEWAHGLGRYHGPHRLESLELKLRRGGEQLALTAHPRAQEWLARHAAALLQPPLPPLDALAEAAAGSCARGAEGAVEGSAGAAEAAAPHSAEQPPPAPVIVPPVSAAYLLKGYLFYPLSAFSWPPTCDDVAEAAASSGHAAPAGEDDALPELAVAAPRVLSPAYLASLPPAIPRDHLAGWYSACVAELTRRRPRSRWVVLPKPFWLGPLVIPCSEADAAVMEAAWADAAHVGSSGALQAHVVAAPPPPGVASAGGSRSSGTPAGAAAVDAEPGAGAGDGSSSDAHATGPAAPPREGHCHHHRALPYSDTFDQFTTAAEKARWLERQAARITPPPHPPGGAGGATGAAAGPAPGAAGAGAFVKYAGAGSGLSHWDGLGAGPASRARVMDARGLAAAVAGNTAAAVATATARALRLLVAELRYHARWRPHVAVATPGAWVEVSRGFVVEPGWDTESDEAHAATFGPEMPPVGARGVGAGR